MDEDGSNLSWYFRVLITLLFLHKSSGCREACSAIGLDDNNIIPDNSFTATSKFNKFYAPHKARFGSDHCWEPNGNDNDDDYLQIDLGKVFVICAVATKGNAKTTAVEWTTEYKISTSIDGNTWVTYSENNNSSKLFPGNTDYDTAVKHDLTTLLLARFIRFIPTQYKKYKALRVEVYSPHKIVRPNPCLAVGLDDSNIIPDNSFTASSEVSNDYKPHKARFSSDRCWEPNRNDNHDDYLQIDLGKVFVICSVATKGNAKTSLSEWTTEYKISTSSDGNLWIPYSENNNSPKLFPGNRDRDTAVKNDLVIPILAKLIRFTPKKYRGYKALRVEVYGFDAKDFSCSSLPVGVASVIKIPDDSMTTSSQYNTSTLASYGRLGYTAGSSWCASTSDSSPYLQVKLGSPYIICGVATQGDHKSDDRVLIYQIQTSTDGSTFTHYSYNNVIQDFGGNTDRNTVVKNPLYEGAVSEYVHIKPESNYGTTSCMRTELYGVQQNTVCSKMSIGVSYGSLVPDHRFTASSYYGPKSDKYLPSRARLRTNKAWEPKTDNPQPGDWLQIDLGSIVYVCAVATQGNGYGAEEYAKKYKLKMSLDNVKWEFYKENNADKEFTGNTDRTTIVTNSLSTPTKTKFLRFYPTDFRGYAAMRVDVYGVPTTCNLPFGVERGGSIKDSKMTSSQSDSGHAASLGRLYGDASWCSNVQNTSEYLQVDLDKMVTLTGIATQGDNTTNKWVKTYTLKYSIGCNTWKEIREGQASAKLFQGNRDKSSIVVRWFTHLVTVRYVRVFPQTWNTGICMRVELFGCKSFYPEIIQLSDKNLSVSANNHVDLECTVKDSEIKYIGWYSNGIDITRLSGGITSTANSVRSVLQVNFTSADNIFNDYKCSNSTASSSSVDCRRIVVCTAQYMANMDAVALKSARVFVKLEKPSILSAPSVGSINSRSAAVSWKSKQSAKLSQASIISYGIKYWNQSTTKVIIAASQVRSKSISGLLPCTDYNVSITSYSVLGPGPWSDLKTFRTDSEKPTVAPSNVKAQAQASQSIRVTWQVPVGVRCPQTKYKVTYTKTAGGLAQTETVSGGSSTSNTLTGLDKWTNYSITVQVGNDKGFGPASTAVTQKTFEDKPDAPPQNLVATAKSPTQIDVSWDSPPADKQNGIITGYKLSYCKTGQCSSPTVKSVTGTSTSLNNLAMFTQYNIKVLACTSKGNSDYTNEITERTHQGPPSKPTDVKISIIKPVGSIGPQVKLEWKPPLHHNGIIRNYSVYYGQTGDENKKIFDSNTLTCTFKACGGVTYKVKVWAITVRDGTKEKKSVTVTIYAPEKASIKRTDKYNTTTYNVIFQPLPATNGPIITYEMKIVRINGSITQDTKFVNVSCAHQVQCHSSASKDCSHVLYDLPQCATYAILVRAYTSKGPGLFSDESTFVTSAPGSPRDLKVLGMTQTTAKLKWSKPQPLARPVEKYIVSYRWEKTYSFEWPDNITSDEKIYDKRPPSQDATFTLAGLYPDTIYSFSVSAETECGKGNNSDEATGVTEIGAPPAPSGGIVNNITSSVGNITLWTISARNGKVSGIFVYVREVKKEKRKRRAQDSSDLKCEKIAPDAAVLSPSATIFTLGDGKSYGSYENKELEKGKSYEIFQCGRTGKTKIYYGELAKIAKGTVPASTGGSDQIANEPGGPDSVVIASVVSVLLILIIGAVVVTLFILWKRRRERDRTEERSFDDLTELDEKKVEKDTNKNRETSHNNHGFATNGNTEPPFTENETDADLYGNAEAIRHQPIPAHKFNQYVNERRETLKDDFKLLSSGQAFPCTIAKDPKHKPKNRYANIITYDHSRVILEGTSDGFDYINASYIHGYDGTPRTYIATQGPNPLTVEDFWHMVWQEKITTIVMLTNLIEAGKVKCHQYWPDSRDQYGQFSVTLHRSDILADYVARIFILSKEGESESRQVHHYQYTSWPDKGVPQHATSVLGFRRKAKAQYTSGGATAPLLVHCSAGVGRTGAFIAVDAMMERVKKDKSVDIFNYVQLMRNNRCTMVQTDEQYAFVHLALQEAITCGNTEIPVLNLNIAISRLSKQRPKDGQTGFEVEWKRLAAISPKVTPENSRAGRREQNLARNRYPDIIPFDSGRVFLSQEHQNYINASFGDAYRERNAFVMAQTPLDNTISDFWHMIHQYKIGSIVVLNKQEEDETFPKYWPSQGSDMYEGIKVEMISSSTRELLVISKLMVTHPMEPQSPHTVLHIQHTDWPVGGVPEDSHSVLDIVDQVQKSQQKSGNAPITVVCSDGVGRSGTFCAIYSLLERVKSEQVIDVFQAIKVLRLGRPNAVATLEQYQYCYRVVQIYLDSFNDYANFSEV